jgi:hypothetical protein
MGIFYLRLGGKRNQEWGNRKWEVRRWGGAEVWKREKEIYLII